MISYFEDISKKKGYILDVPINVDIVITNWCNRFLIKVNHSLRFWYLNNILSNYRCDVEILVTDETR